MVRTIALRAKQQSVEDAFRLSTAVCPMYLTECTVACICASQYRPRYASSSPPAKVLNLLFAPITHRSPAISPSRMSEAATDSPALAGRCGECCTRTVQHSGVARGTVEVIAGLETYVARPRDDPENLNANASKIILFFADVFGPMYNNAKLAMDYWAEEGAWRVLARTYAARGRRELPLAS